MATKKSDMVINVRAEVQQATKALRDISKEIKQMSAHDKGILGAAKAFDQVGIALNLATGYAKKAAAVVTGLVSDYKSVADAQARLTAQIKTMGGSGQAARIMSEFASSISSVTNVSYESVAQVEQLLASVKGLSRDGLKDATSLALDMSVALGSDAKKAATTLAKALAEPDKAADKLKDKLVMLDSAQQEQIKTFIEAGETSKAQKLILDAVADSYGGVAKEVANTDTGKLTQISTAWKSIRQGLGGSIVNTISPYLDSVLATLQKLQGWIDRHVDQGKVKNAVEAGGDLSVFSREALQGAADKYQRLITGLKSGGDLLFDANGEPIDVTGSATASEVQKESYRAYAKARDNYNKIMMAMLGNDASASATLPAFPASDSVVANEDSVADKIEQLRQSMLQAGEAMRQYGEGEYAQAYKKDFEEKRDAYLSALYPYELSLPGPEAQAANPMQSFLASNSSASDSLKLASINGKILEANGYLAAAQASGDTDAATALSEIIEKLKEERSQLGVTSDAISDVGDSWKDTWEEAQQYVNQLQATFSSFYDFGAQLRRNEIDSVSSQLEEQTKLYDDYLSDLEDKQERQKESLSLMYDSSLISAEDYMSALGDLDEARGEAEDEAQAREEELTAKKNALQKKAFESDKMNKVASTLINGATAVAGVWANPGYPAAVPLSIMLGAQNTAQVATILAQKYTPMATGGVVTKPTHAYIGEGAEAEAVMPLSKLFDNFRPIDSEPRQGLNLTINIGDGYTSDEVAEKVYRSISDLQGRGVLPSWA